MCRRQLGSIRWAVTWDGRLGCGPIRASSKRSSFRGSCTRLNLSALSRATSYSSRVIRSTEWERALLVLPGADARCSTDLFHFQEFALLQFGEGLPQLLLRVHDDGAVPGNRLLQRLS